MCCDVRRDQGFDVLGSKRASARPRNGNERYDQFAELLLTFPLRRIPLGLCRPNCRQASSHAHCRGELLFLHSASSLADTSFGECSGRHPELYTRRRWPLARDTRSPRLRRSRRRLAGKCQSDAYRGWANLPLLARAKATAILQSIL